MVGECEIREEFIKELCDNVILAEGDNVWNRSGLQGKMQLELALMPAYMNKDSYMKNTVLAKVKTDITENYTPSTGLNNLYLKNALISATSSHRNVSLDVMINALRTFLSRNELDGLSPLLQRNMQDLLLHTLQITDSKVRNYNMFLKEAAAVLSKISPRPLNPRRHAGIQANDILAGLQIIRETKQFTGKVSRSHMDWVHEILETTSGLTDQRYFGAYSQALKLVNFTGMTKAAYENLGEYLVEHFDKSRFVRTLYDVRTSSHMSQRLQFLHLLQRISGKNADIGDKGVTMDDMSDALEAALTLYTA